MLPLNLCYHLEDKHKRNSFSKYERKSKIKNSNCKDANARKLSNLISTTTISIVINIITTLQRLKCNAYNEQEFSSLIMSVFICSLLYYEFAKIEAVKPITVSTGTYEKIHPILSHNKQAAKRENKLINSANTRTFYNKLTSANSRSLFITCPMQNTF